LGEGGNFPSAIKAVALWFPRKERAFATALFNSGTNVGAIIAPAVIPPIAYAWGWRAAFVVAGLVGLLWLLLWIPLYEIPERSRRLKAAELQHIQSDLEPPQPTTRVKWGALLKAIDLKID
jgi:ACS family hexuronate transporter-like MFS transporter